MMRTVALVPIKMNNERTPGKNTKPFSDGTPLIHFILKTLKICKTVDEIYVYCSDERIKDYLVPGVKYLKRDCIYDTPEADVNDMFRAFSLAVDADVYVLAHATAPFLTAASIDNAVQAVLGGKYDSAFSARKMQEFVWKDGKPMNYDVNKIPRTQDLPPLYVETTGLYVFAKDVIQKKRSRIGYIPYIQEVSVLEATDINNPVDFEIADSIYSHLFMGRR